MRSLLTAAIGTMQSPWKVARYATIGTGLSAAFFGAAPLLIVVVASAFVGMSVAPFFDAAVLSVWQRRLRDPALGRVLLLQALSREVIPPCAYLAAACLHELLLEPFMNSQSSFASVLRTVIGALDLVGAAG